MIKQMDHKIQEFLSLSSPGQIGMVVRDIRRTIEAYSKLIQWGPFEVTQREYAESNCTYHGKPGNFKSLIALAQLGSIQLELIQPLEGETIWLEFLKSGREGLHHLGFLIDHIEERIAAMKEIGIGVLQSGERPGRKWAYMDTEPLIGTIIEFRETIL